MAREYHKVIFDHGYKGDSLDVTVEFLGLVLSKQTLGQGYQVVDGGNEIGLFTLDGQKINLPNEYGVAFSETYVEPPEWGLAQEQIAEQNRLAAEAATAQALLTSQEEPENAGS